MIDEMRDLGTESFEAEGLSGSTDGGTIKSVMGELTDSTDERVGSLLREKEAILTRTNKIATTTVGVSNHWAAGGKGFNSSNTERFEAGKKVGFGGLKVAGELVAAEPR